MAEQSLYRRHRPQSFSEVVGQEHVVRTLSNAIERDRTHHAYLFVGSRGTGKTSMAKILARSLNCVEGPTLTPCGVCESCRSIAAGNSMDVIEMDAASNRSVDDIRELRERVGYAPAEGRWKVYILDEAHMLTREAWNAFLKTLEEPPPNTVFVLATTEAHKVMPTIVDRCQRFDFARPAPEDIATVVRRVASAESIEIDDGAIGAIGRAANGSFRDALGTLDQLVAYSGTSIATDDVLGVLGVADAELLFAAADAIGASDGAAALGVVSDLGRSGRDAARFAADLVVHLRQLLVIGTIGDIPEHFFVAADQQARLTSQAERLGAVALVRAIDLLSAAVAAIREGDEARMTVELALLRAARPEIDPSAAAMAQRMERLERSLAGAPAPAAPPAPPQTPSPIPPTQSAAEPASPSPSQPEPHASRDEREANPSQGAEHAGGADQAPTEPAGAAPDSTVAAIAHGAVATAEQIRSTAGDVAGGAASAAAGAVDLEQVAGLWNGVLDHMRQSGAGLLSAALADARPVRVDAESAIFEVGFPPRAAFNRRKAEVKENRERVFEAVKTVVGAPLRPVYVTLDGEPEQPPEPAQPTPPGADAAGEAELYEKFLSEFDAEEMTDETEEETS